MIRARLDAAGGQAGPRGRMVGAGIRRLPARLRRDDLQGPGQDPGPHLSLPHASLAFGGELRGADPAARERAGVRGAGNGARRGATRAADGARRDQGGLGRLGHGGRTDAGAAGARDARSARRSWPTERQAEVATRREAERRGQREIVVSPPTATAAPPVAQPPETDERAAPEILIPALRGSGRARQSRPGSGCRQHRAPLRRTARCSGRRRRCRITCVGAYRDPHAAKARLDEMVKRQGWTSTAARLGPDPTQLGELHGERGFSPEPWAKTRAAWRSGPPTRSRPPGAHRRGGSQGRADVSRERGSAAQGRRHADSEAERAGRGGGRALAAASDEKVRAELWRGMTADKAIGAELRRFSAAVQQRFGEDTVRAMRRSAVWPRPSVARQHQAALSAVSRSVQVLGQGEIADTVEAVRERFAQRRELGLGRGLSR